MLNSKVLFIYPNIPFGFNKTGGSSVLTSRIYSLIRLLKDIQLVRLVNENDSCQYSDYLIGEEYREINNHEEVVFQELLSNEIVVNLKTERWDENKYLKKIKIFLNPEFYLSDILNSSNKKAITTIINKISPDLIICEHLYPALLVNYINPKTNWIYCHHDWLYKLRKLKIENHNLRYIYSNFLSKKSEYRIVRKSSGVICLSEFERNEIIKTGQEECIVQYVTYPKIVQEGRTNNEFNLVHFGGLSATANRLGLEMFLKDVWDKIKLFIPDIKLKIVGNTSLALEYTLYKINNDESIITYGHCEDLNEVLLPNDIHIIPWPYSTGSRTRVPIALQFKQIILSTQNAICGFSEMKNGFNCTTVDSIKDFPLAVLELYGSKEKCAALSQNGYDTFCKYYSINQTYNKLGEFMKKIICHQK